jgi:uncharacterized repeat protein (TIGR04076 family)
MKLCNRNTGRATLEIMSDNCGCFGKSHFILKDIIPGGMCPDAFRTFYPYYLTLTSGGWFPWVEENDGVCVHCPYPKGIIAKIYREKDDVQIQIVNNPEECAYGYRRSTMFKIVEISGNGFPPDALATIIPYLGTSQEVRWRCPKHNKEVAIHIQRNMP